MNAIQDNRQNREHVLMVTVHMPLESKAAERSKRYFRLIVNSLAAGSWNAAAIIARPDTAADTAKCFWEAKMSSSIITGDI